MRISPRGISIVLGVLAVSLSAGCASGGLGDFGAEMGKKEVMGKMVRVPYTHLVSYYGYVKPGEEPDEVRDGKKFYYLYLWVPAVAPELGVRMVSPVKDLGTPAEGDFVSPIWEEGSQDMENYFDTYITLEKCKGVTSLDQVKAKKDTILAEEWVTMERNDDSSEMPPIPDGRNYNSLMRVVSDTGDPMKALSLGLYRIGFTTYKKGEVKGTFLAQVGAPVKLPGVSLAKDVAALVPEE